VKRFSLTLSGFCHSFSTTIVSVVPVYRVRNIFYFYANTRVLIQVLNPFTPQVGKAKN